MKEVDTIKELLILMIESGASDLHLSVGSTPILRIDGQLETQDIYKPLTSERLRPLLYSLLHDKQRIQFDTTHELDFSYALPGVSRFRGNYLYQRGTVGGVFRAIPPRPFTIDELGLPSILKDLAAKPRGLLLATGPTGCGKSTTLAAITDYINENFKKHIITIEDPIEFIHRNKLSLVRQRELESDTYSFADALKHALRQDPDVLLVGEMRDMETVSLALTAAETGHLVLATLHTTGAAAAIERIVDVFPPHQQSQVKTQLSSILEGVISQVLMPRIDTVGRVMASEVLTGTAAIRNLIRENKLHQVQTVIQSSLAFGMHTLEMNLRDLYFGKVISKGAALMVASDASEFLRLIGERT